MTAGSELTMALWAYAVSLADEPREISTPTQVRRRPIKAALQASSGRILLLKGNSQSRPSSLRDSEWYLRVESSGRFSGGADAEATTTRGATRTGGLYCASDEGVITANRWYHLAVVIDAARNSTQVFVDGKLASTCDSTPDPGESQDPDQAHGPWQLTASESGVYVGGYGNKNDAWNGMIDDVRIYARALNAAEIAQLAQ